MMGTMLPPRALLLRGAGFLAFCAILMGLAPADLAVGLAAAAVASWVSALLWPPGGGVSLLALPRFLARFLAQSVIAGVDVARRAFTGRPALRPGFIACRSSLPGGMAREASCTLMGLQPGKLPVAADADGTLHVHCLDLGQPVAAQIAADEAAFRRLLRGEAGDG
ncbi:hypothetical protein HMPREF9946_02646 [Acetobacteraceae bacterium AT-5844]|nr:hypothetical protein HMPREF9946_02646 [Acetobacteraceae bacterium AT-5844]